MPVLYKHLYYSLIGMGVHIIFCDDKNHKIHSPKN